MHHRKVRSPSLCAVIDIGRLTCEIVAYDIIITKARLTIKIPIPFAHCRIRENTVGACNRDEEE